MTERLSPARARFLAAALATASFAYQLLIANGAAFFSGGRVFWHSVTVGVYLLGLGLGTWRSEKIPRPDAATTLMRLEMRLVALGGAAMLLIFAAHAAYRVWFHTRLLDTYVATQPNLFQFIDARWWPFAAFIGVMLAITVVIGYWTGFEVPMLLILSKNHEEGTILGLNYLGAMAATLGLAVFLLPRFDLVTLGLAVGIFNALTLLVLRRSWKPLALALALALALPWTGKLLDLHAMVFYYYRFASLAGQATVSERFAIIQQRKKVERHRSPYQRLDIAEVPWPGTPPVTTLFLDGRFQFDSWNERFYHETMAHLPPLLAGTTPKKVLVLGAGDGLLVRELLKFGEGLASIKMIELDPKMVELARTHPALTELNERSLDDPKVELVVGDGFHFVRKSKETFDAVFVDFPFPHNYDTGKLYSREFYKALIGRLAPGGFAVIDAPIFSEEEGFPALPQEYRDVNSVMYSTLAAAGFKTVRGIAANVYGFVMAIPEKRELALAPTLPPGLKVFALKGADLADLQHQRFPHEVAPRHVNSIFRPRLLDLPDTHY